MGADEFVAAFAEYLREDFDKVVKSPVADHVPERAYGTMIWVPCSDNECGQAGKHKGSSTHGAGFKRGDERAVMQAPSAQFVAGFTQCDHFGVGGGVARVSPVVGGGGNLVALGVVEDSTGRKIVSAGVMSEAGDLESAMHPGFVMSRAHVIILACRSSLPTGRAECDLPLQAEASSSRAAVRSKALPS